MSEVTREPLDVESLREQIARIIDPVAWEECFPREGDPNPVGAAAGHPSLARGQVWCRKCGATRRVSSSVCLQVGWPRCCGQTMTIDSPEEQDRLSASELRDQQVSPPIREGE